MSISTIGGSTTTHSIYGSQDISGQGQKSSATQSSFDRTIDTESQTILSLNQDPSKAPDNTETDQIAQGLASAINVATTVDPVTGQRELLSGASSILATTVTSLLTQNGFSDDEAKAAVTELNKELAQGGKVSLSLQESSNVTTSKAAGLANASGAAVGSQVTSSAFSSTIDIGIDLGTGSLSVSLQSQSTFSTATSTAQSGSAAGKGLDSFLNGAQQPGTVSISQYGLSVQSSSSVQELLNTDQSPQTPLQQLLDHLSGAKVHKPDQTSNALQQLARIASGAKQGNSAAQNAAAILAPGVTVSQDGSGGGTASTKVGVSVPAAVRHTDHHGYGSTIYRRPDGSLGTFSVRPTRVTA
ncbi:MAG TPA: hypothetical protein VM689_24355 [Aliidongia sp.]|nr:hypothetical protein [Aliidongia sp.]